MNVANNQMPSRLYEIGPSYFTHCRLKLASFGNLCIVWPVLFELLQKWTTQPFTIIKMRCLSKRNYVNMCLFHNVFKRTFWLPVSKDPPMTSFARLCNSRWRIFRTLKWFFKVKTGLNEQKIYRFRRCHVCTKRLCGAQNSIFRVYMLFKCEHFYVTWLFWKTGNFLVFGGMRQCLVDLKHGLAR